MGTLDEVDFPRVAASKTSGASTSSSAPKKSGIKRKNDDDTLFGDGTKVLNIMCLFLNVMLRK